MLEIIIWIAGIVLVLNVVGIILIVLLWLSEELLARKVIRIINTEVFRVWIFYKPIGISIYRKRFKRIGWVIKIWIFRISLTLIK